MNSKNMICITKYDYDRLIDILPKYTSVNKISSNIKDLLTEIKRAKIVDSHSIPPDYVTMNSIFELKNLEEVESYQFKLVFPNEADIDNNKISVLAPIGTAVLGYKVGDVIKWNVPSGEKHFQIANILYQPEASGDYHL